PTSGGGSLRAMHDRARAETGRRVARADELCDGAACRAIEVLRRAVQLAVEHRQDRALDLLPRRCTRSDGKLHPRSPSSLRTTHTLGPRAPQRRGRAVLSCWYTVEKRCV